MVVQLSAKFQTDLVTAGTLNKIKRENNERTGKDIVQYVVPSKFTLSAYSEFAGVVRKRNKNYRAWKQKKVGHEIPNVLTGQLKETFRSGGPGIRITKTANGGRVIMRVYWAAAGRMKANGTLVKSGIRESQRQELEYVSPKQNDMLAKRQADRFVAAVNDPKNRRKRAVKRKKV